MEENTTIQEIKDHVLVRAWLNQEGGGTEEEDHCLSQVDSGMRAQAHEELLLEKLVIASDGGLRLVGEGARRAKEMIRRHRLAECLFEWVFNLSKENVRDQACVLEHERVLSMEAIEGICSFLGHPPACPHGRPIPSGNCCRLFTNEVRPLVIPLDHADIGGEYQIIFITPKYHALLERLAGLGVVPGSKIKMSQKLPAMVFKVQETEVALDREVAAGIYVKSVLPTR